MPNTQHGSRVESLLSMHCQRTKVKNDRVVGRRLIMDWEYPLDDKKTFVQPVTMNLVQIHWVGITEAYDAFRQQLEDEVDDDAW